MCGILGAFGNIQKDRFQKALDKLIHRGPDSNGIYEEENLFLGHTRLSIIDPAPEANQPFITEDFVLVFNGEIYNFQELIKKYDLLCTTKSDTEVIIRLYEKIGIGCLNQFNGMFAFALLDKKNGKIVLARDRFGKKPLYYSNSAKFIFSSEIKSILSLFDTKPQLNLRALCEYLAYLSPLPPNTFFEGIKKLPSGHFAIFDIVTETLQIEKYYDLVEESKKITEQKNIEELIFDSLKLRLVSDVEVASLLSGGIDSTLISALYTKLSNKKISTFSIGYEDHKKYDELKYAKIAAKCIDSNHFEYILKKSEFIESIPQVISQLDEPLGDSACIPVYFLSRLVHQNGFKTVLSGEGADEIFLGYDRYFEILANKREKEYGGFIEPFNQEELNNLLKNPIKLPRFEEIKSKTDGANTLSIIDLTHWIPEVLMTKVDRMSMAWSLESRAPFLDYHLVEYLLSLQDSDKMGITTKHLLKKIAQKYIPAEIIHRQKKGFSSPYFEWYFDTYGDEILDLFQRVNKKLNLFNEDYLKLLYNDATKNKQKLWSLIIFCLWFENYYEEL